MNCHKLKIELCEFCIRFDSNKKNVCWVYWFNNYIESELVKGKDIKRILLQLIDYNKRYGNNNFYLQKAMSINYPSHINMLETIFLLQ